MKAKGHLAILLANVIFGLGVPVTKALLDEWVTPMGYMASRCVFAALIFWVVAAFMPREHVGRKDLWVILLGGLLGFVISQTLTAESLKFTTPVYFSLVAALTPVAVMILEAIFLRESITGIKMVGVALAIAGALLMVFMSWGNGVGKESMTDDLIGIILAVLSVLTWAIYLIITRKVSAKYSSVTQMKHFFLISAVVILPIALTLQHGDGMEWQRWRSSYFLPLDWAISSYLMP